MFKMWEGGEVGMKCPKCCGKVRTVETRPKPDNTNYRRKKCEVCGYRFSTVELTATDFAKQVIR